MSPEAPEPFDSARILATLDAHGVEYLLVGGVGARAHGARRETYDIDFVPRDTDENFDRLAAAMRELRARLRVGRMTDDEAQQLPVIVDAATLRGFGSSTWTTDAGPLDILAELPDRKGRRHTYDDLATRRVTAEVDGIRVHVASLNDIVASKEFAARAKDHHALPELREMLRSVRPEATTPPPSARSADRADGPGS